jgi:hypothetical protein
VSARTGWLANVICASLVIGKSDGDHVVVTTGGHGEAVGPYADIFKPPMDNIYPFSG